MTRRRVLAVIFGALIGIFMAGSFATVTAVRAQLIADVDDSLRTDIAGVSLFLTQLADADLAALASPVNERAMIRIDSVGAVIFAVPAGTADDPIALPDLPSSRIIDRIDDVYTVDGTDDGPNYRVIATQLDDGGYVAVAQPLNDVRSTITSLARTLLATLFAILLVLGAIFWWLLRLSLKPYNNMIDTAQAIAEGDLDRRVTEVAADPDLERLTTSLNTMLDRIQELFVAREAAEARVKQFAADASHELRTPITTIAGYSEVYLSGAATDSESVNKQMTRINSEANRMGRLVNDLLTLARLDQGRGLAYEYVDVHSLITDAIADAKVTNPYQEFELTTSGRANAVVGDHDALQQVWANLLTNARLHAPGALVEIGVTYDDAIVTVTVSDDGPGMTSEVADHIFDRFYRAEESRTSSVHSSGLGLSIVAAIVTGHGGSISVASKPGSGSTFMVELPTVPAGHSLDAPR